MNLNPKLFQHLFNSIGQNGSTTQILYELIEKKLLFLSPNVENICHRDAKIFYENPEIVKDIIHPDDKDYVFNKIKKEEDQFETKKYLKYLHHPSVYIQSFSKVNNSSSSAAVIFTK